MAYKIKSKHAQRVLVELGDNLKTARLKRRISVKDFADRVGVSARTITRLEKGDDGVSTGTLAMACLVLGEIHRIGSLLDPASDDTGLLLERNRLPKRIQVKSGKIPNRPASGDRNDSKVDRVDDQGVSF
ncbi:MAG: helix-turn-helix transcriptional regulator [Gammaproteobacteria bacterium]|nr:helix-turn-helix transcriptional regulator [Gammaproteobacteria bacterium]